MNTTFALLARFESPTVELKQVCQEFFGITPKTAEQRAKACDFPFLPSSFAIQSVALH